MSGAIAWLIASRGASNSRSGSSPRTASKKGGHASCEPLSRRSWKKRLPSTARRSTGWLISGLCVHEILQEREQLTRSIPERLEPTVAERPEQPVDLQWAGADRWIDRGSGVTLPGETRRLDVIVHLGPFDPEDVRRAFQIAHDARIFVTDQPDITQDVLRFLNRRRITVISHAAEFAALFGEQENPETTTRVTLPQS
jgi:hypothetical protein